MVFTVSFISLRFVILFDNPEHLFVTWQFYPTSIWLCQSQMKIEK